MVKLYHNGRNGEIIIQTDARDWKVFCAQLATALGKATDSFEGDYENKLKEVLLHAIPIALKLASDKTELMGGNELKIHEGQGRILTCRNVDSCGYSDPNECELIAEHK